MARPIEATPPVTGKDAERLLEVLKKNVCSPEEAKRRQRDASRYVRRMLGEIDVLDDLKEFHEKFEQPILDKPHIPPRERETLRHRLITEESLELLKGIDLQDLEQIADGIADVIYVVVGTALEYGIPLERVWNEVHAANMRKEGGGKRADGKILKPSGWKPPDIKKALFGK